MDRRWAEVASALTNAPDAWAEWGRTELTGDVVGAALCDRLGWGVDSDQSSGALDRARDTATRTALGQVFTPEPLSRLVAEVSGCGQDQGGDASLLDPACGAGSLLIAAADARRAEDRETAAVLTALEGWDRDPVAAWACRASLVLWALKRPTGPIPGPLRVEVRDALEVRRACFGTILSNPPYLEAKRMGKAAPGLRKQLSGRFPQLRGAFDVYLAFCWAALDWVAPGGRIVLLLPNKVLQGRYAADFRRALLEGAGARLTQLVDLARLKPRPFPNASVYPVILRIDRGASSSTYVGRRMTRPADLADAPRLPVDHSAVRQIGGEQPLFVPFAETWPDLAPLLSLPRLGSIARIVSTCSFHARGLRERFVTPNRPARHAHPYIGGPSRARRTEIAPFRLRWEGWWITYDQDALRRDFRNPLPDLHTTFLRSKVILCQHAVRVRAWADLEGRYVTKDTYPVAWPTGPHWTVPRLTAVMQSTVFTALYNTFFQGILVGGETYHYLPAFLSMVPVPPGDHAALADADELVLAIQADDGSVDGALWEELDRRVARAYGLSEPARQRMIAVHLARVGAERPG